MAVPMILDRGDAAQVAVIDCSRMPFVGMRFLYGGTVWEVTRAQNHARGWVAQPAPAVGQPARSPRPLSSPRCVREV